MKTRWLLLTVLGLIGSSYYFSQTETVKPPAGNEVRSPSSSLPATDWDVNLNQDLPSFTSKLSGQHSPKDIKALELMVALEAGDWDKILAYLRAGGDPNVADEKGRTILMWAAMSAKIEVIEELIKSKANLELKDENGRNALMVATLSEHPEAIAKLMAAGASVHEENLVGENLIHIAVGASNPELLSTFVKAGVDLQKRFGEHEMDAYMLATVNGDLQMMEALHTLYPEFIHTLDRQGRSVAHYSCGEGDLRATAAAIRHGARLDVPDRYGRTAFDYGIEMGNDACVSFIEEAGLREYL